MLISKTARVIISFVSLIFMAGTIVLLVLLIIAGAREREPLQRIHFLEADTSGIPGAPNGKCHWTLYGFCEVRNGQNYHCTAPAAAYPFDPVHNFHTKQNMPTDFIQHPRKYYYLSRFLYAFYIISLFFSFAAFVVGFAALCSHRAALLAALVAFVANGCIAFCAAVMTACFVMAQNAFRAAGREARIGVKATAFSWTALVCAWLAMVGWFVAGWAGRKARHHGKGAKKPPGRKERPYRRHGGFSRLGSVRKPREEWREKAAPEPETESQRRLTMERGAGTTA